MTGRETSPREQHTISSEGLTLTVFEGPRAGPTVLFVHGFPDTHAVWDPVVTLLSDRFHSVAYDVRGAGASDVPKAQADYGVSHLVTDLVAVMDATSPDEPVHLVGHDWGSIQAWEAVVRARSDPRLAGRIASYTTISGPCLHHLAGFRQALTRGGIERRQEAVRQLLRSWYVVAFHVPVVPELLLRRLNRRLLACRPSGSHHFPRSLPDDAAHGVNLYRANIFHVTHVPGGPSTALPVQLIVPLRDKYVTPALTRDVDRYAIDLTRVEIDAGHWVQRSQPVELAEHIAGFVTAHAT